MTNLNIDTFKVTSSIEIVGDSDTIHYGENNESVAAPLYSYNTEDIISDLVNGESATRVKRALMFMKLIEIAEKRQIHIAYDDYRSNLFQNNGRMVISVEGKMSMVLAISPLKKSISISLVRIQHQEMKAGVEDMPAFMKRYPAIYKDITTVILFANREFPKMFKLMDTKPWE